MTQPHIFAGSRNMVRFLLSTSLLASALALDAFINEFHYRNHYTDVNLFVEIAGPAHEEAVGHELILYQGRDGAQFRNAFSLTGQYFEGNISGDFGFIEVPLKSHGGIRNGKHNGDGIALVNQGSVVQFISYNGTFVATTGPAANMTSQDIGVQELRNNTLGLSLQLQGSGRYVENFTWWSEPKPWTPGQVNVGQVLQTQEEYAS